MDVLHPDAADGGGTGAAVGGTHRWWSWHAPAALAPSGCDFFLVRDVAMGFVVGGHDPLVRTLG